MIGNVDLNNQIVAVEHVNWFWRQTTVIFDTVIFDLILCTRLTVSLITNSLWVVR